MGLTWELNKPGGEKARIKYVPEVEEGDEEEEDSKTTTMRSCLI